MAAIPHLRVARPTDNLEALLRFYEQWLGFTALYRLEDHDGFDNVMLSQPGVPYHFELMTKHGYAVEHAPTLDNLLAFHLPAADRWTTAAQRLQATGFDRVPAFNPCWDRDA